MDKINKIRANLFFFFTQTAREMGDGRKSGSSGLDAMWFVSGLHSYAHDPGLCSNRQMSAKPPCPGVGDRSGGRRASGDQRVKPCGRVLS